MTRANLRPGAWNYLILALALFCAEQIRAQCDTVYVDLSSYPPDYSISLPGLSRNGQCCGARSSDECLNFVVTLNPNSAAIRFFQTTSPAGGSETWQLNCGTEYNYRDTACISGVGPHRITFCKPGTNADDYVILAIARPTVPPSDSARIGCTEQLDVFGMKPGSITWNSITGGLGLYNSYLDSTTIRNPIFTPSDTFSLPYVDYLVCGSPYDAVASCGYASSCDTMRIYVFDSLTATFDPVSPSFCNTGSGSGVNVTVSAQGGLPGYNYEWHLGSGSNIIDNDSVVFANTRNTYNVFVTDRLTGPGCPPLSFGVPVDSFGNSSVTASNDTLLCATNPIALLTATKSNASGLIWSGGSGVYTPNNTSSPISYTPTAAEIAAGHVDIYVQVTGIGAGCTLDRDTVRINFIDSIAVSISSTAISCFSDLSTLHASVDSGGIGPFTYQWNNGVNSQNNAVAPGTYTVIVTDASGLSCKGSSSITVSDPIALDVVMSSFGESSPGSCDGSATVSVNGGASPYSYLWSGGQTSITATALCYGVHQVTVTDNNGCTIVGSVVVNNVNCNSLLVTVASSTLLCYGDSSASLHVVVSGGTPDYSYLWNTRSTNDTITGLGAGAYTVTVVDALGCIQLAVAEVIQPPRLNNFFSQLNVTSIGGNNGQATANVAGGSPAYSYLWSNGQTTRIATGLSVGAAPLSGKMYYITVTDANGCQLRDSVYITQPPCNALVLGVNITHDIQCFGDLDASATVYAIGGQPGYTYSWMPGAYTTASASALGSGPYSVTVEDANRCIQYLDFNLNSPQQLNVVLTPNAVSCYGLEDGTIETTVTGGTYPYYFNWSNGSNAEDLAYLESGSYTVTVTDANGCSFIKSTLITQPDPIVLESFITNILCFGDSTGAISITPTGGIMPYSFEWSNGSTAQNQINLHAGAFQLRFIDANNCRDSVILDVSSPDSLSVDSVTILCPIGGASVADIVIHANGGVGPYAYSVNNGSVFGTVGDSTFTVATGQSHAIRILDQNGCVADTAFNALIPATVRIDSINFNPCYPAGTTNTSVQFFLSGGTGLQYQVSVDSGATYATAGVYSLSLATGRSYSVVVRDSLGCLSDTSLLVLPTPFDATNTVSNYNGYGVSCLGYSDGAINVTVVGGAVPYSFQWSSGQITEDLNNVPAGTYRLTITDTNGCKLIETATITEPSGVTLSASVTSNHNGAQISCNGASDGAVNVAAIGGTGTYSYLWSNGRTTANNTGLGAGNYRVTVNDGNSCPAIASVTLTQPTAVTATVSSSVSVSCFAQATGTATAAGSGGTGTYSYLWNTIPSQNTIVASGLSAGTYRVTVSDLNSCTATANVTITQPSSAVSVTASVSSNYNGSQITCNGASNGAATASGSGGTGGFGYVWSNGQTNAIATGLAAGSYRVTATDANGCSVSNSVTVTQPTAVTASVSSSVSVSCFAQATGTATAAGSGGTGTYSYLWNTIPSQNTFVASGLSAGTYRVTVSDVNSCTATANVTITQSSSAVSVTASVSSNYNGSQITCNGASNGAATASGNGGTGGFSYVWSNGQTTVTATGLAAGSYRVTATDVNGCSVSNSVTVTEPTAVTASVSSSVSVSCFAQATGTATAAGSGGTGTYSYLWNTIPSQNTFVASGLSAGIYRVTVSDVNSCTATANVTITQPSSAVSVTASVSSNYNGSQITCNGASNGAATASGNGGTGGFSYVWSNGQTTVTATGLAAGSYRVTATDANGCSVSNSVTVTQPTAVTATVSSSVSVSCFAQATGTATAAGSGGTGTYSYLWNTIPSQNTFLVSGLSAGIYRVTVSDVNSCTATANVTIAQPSSAVSVTASVSSNYNGSQITCNGASNGAATATGNGGTGAFGYVWSNGQTNAIATGLAAGSYRVTATDANGCSVSNTVTVTEPTSITLSTSVDTFPSGTQVSCDGASDGTARVSATGGTVLTTYSYLWSNGQTSAVATALSAGVYSVTVSDLNGCFRTANLTVSDPNGITLTAAVSSNYNGAQVSCFGSSNGSASALGIGGTGTLSYLWSNAQTGNSSTALSAGTYRVTVTDINGCFTSASITLTQPTAVTVSIAVDTLPTGTQISCNGTYDAEASATASGGTGTYTYLWSNAQTNAMATALGAGIYQVTATDINGCTASRNVTITEPSPISLTVIVDNFGSGTQISCHGAADGLATANGRGGTGGFTYVWSNGQSTATATGLAAGVYTVTATDANGCTVSRSITVTEPSAVSLTVSINTFPTGTQISCFGANDGSAIATALGGTGAFSYLWSNGQSTALASGLSAGLYSVTASDVNGCTISTAITVSQPSVLSVTVAVDTFSLGSQISCNGSSDGEATASASGGTPIYTYLWSNGQTNANATALSAGSYSVMATDANGCTATAIITLTEPSEVSLTIAIDTFNSGTQISCYGASDATVSAVVSGGTGTYNYIWSNGQSTALINGLSAGVYTVTVSDANNCSETASVTISEPTQITISTASLSYSGFGVSCNGASDGQINSTAYGGTAPYSYLWSNGQTTAGISGLTAGSYSLTLSDVNGCSVVVSATLSQPDSLLSAVNINNTVSCSGLSDGSVFLTVNGGMGNYQYAWSNGASTGSVSGLSAGVYTVTVSDLNGCSFVHNSVIMSEPAILIIDGRGQDPSCQLPNGSVNVTVSGGTTPYVYLWSNAETTEDISGLNSGIYSLTVTDIRGCEAIFIDTIIQNNIPISISGAVVSSICYRENTGSIVVTASDGIAPYSFVWSNGQNGNYVDRLAEGSYLVTATDASGCTASASFEVQILQDTLSLGLNALTYANGYNISTHAAFDGFINSNIQGGVGPYSFSWSNGASTVNLSNVSAGFYSLMVVDSNGCAVNATILLNEPAPGMPEMPEGISPNDDGKNDVFVIRNIEFYPDNNIYIYNRWGEQLLSFNAYDNTSVRWRGENKDGENLPEGTYYVVAVINVNGEDMVLKGHVDIRR